jgi:hypothetical protein
MNSFAESKTVTSEKNERITPKGSVALSALISAIEGDFGGSLSEM